MPARSWKNLSPRARRLLVIAATIDGLLRVAALVDLRRRPPAEVRGSRKRWALALGLVNSVGVVPGAYFLCGRRPAGGSPTEK